MAYEACEPADFARAAVPTGEHELNPDGTARAPGAVLADAARVLATAQRFLEAAAAFKRMGGADRKLIGAILDMPPHIARVRFAMSEAAFREELLSPRRLARAEPLKWRAARGPTWLKEPLETALDLDTPDPAMRRDNVDLSSSDMTAGAVTRRAQR